MIEGGEVAGFAWAVLVPRIVHPIKVAIIEAMLWVDRPLSPSLMTKSFGSADYYLSIVSYHVETLEEVGAIVVAKRQPVRGAEETFYRIPKRMLAT